MEIKEDVQNNGKKLIGGVTGKGFLPGKSGNPGGRPQLKWLTDVVEEMLKEKLSDPIFREQYKEHLWEKLMGKGVVSAMTLDSIWERTEGRLTIPVDVSGSIDIGSVLERWRNDCKECA